MAENTPFYMDINNVYSGDELGLPNRDIFSEGTVGVPDLAVTAGTGNTINVAAGAAWITGDTDGNRQPTYRVYNDAVVNKGITPDPTNPRYVRVVAQVTDATFAGVLRNWAITTIHGTPAPSPAVPALPASAMDMATILVPAAAASSAAYTITDNRHRAVVGGGTVATSPRVRAVRNATFQSIPNATSTAMIWNDADSYDTDNLHDPATNPSRITVFVPGVYIFATTVVFAASATGYRGVAIRTNGANYFGQVSALSLGAIIMDVSTSWPIPMSAGEYAEVWVYQTSGGALNAGSNNATTGALTYFDAVRVGSL